MNVMVSAAAMTAASAAVATDAGPSDDPVFALIAAHQQAVRDHEAGYDVQVRLENELPSEQYQTHFHFDDDELQVVETDVPRWIENERRIMGTYRARQVLDLQLINTEPTSLAGAAAMLTYASELTKEDGFGERYLDEGQFETSLGRPWEFFMLRQVAEALGKMV